MPRPRSAPWRVFWIAATLAFLGVNAWNVFLGTRRSVLTKSYMLGADAVEEQIRLSWLGWPYFRLRLGFVNADEADATTNSKDAVLRTIGGDIAVELTTPTGEVVIPRTLLSDAAPQMNVDFQPKRLDPYVLRVTMTKTSATPHPREVVLLIYAPETGWHPLGWAFDIGLLIVALGVGAMILRVTLSATRKAQPGTGAAPRRDS